MNEFVGVGKGVKRGELVSMELDVSGEIINDRFFVRSVDKLLRNGRGTSTVRAVGGEKMELFRKCVNCGEGVKESSADGYVPFVQRYNLENRGAGVQALPKGVPPRINGGNGRMLFEVCITFEPVCSSCTSLLSISEDVFVVTDALDVTDFDVMSDVVETGLEMQKRGVLL